MCIRDSPGAVHGVPGGRIGEGFGSAGGRGVRAVSEQEEREVFFSPGATAGVGGLGLAGVRAERSRARPDRAAVAVCDVGPREKKKKRVAVVWSVVQRDRNSAAAVVD